jgi:bis(5'-nucleosyl)-tetraphosphatase (symmetrical)
MHLLIGDLQGCLDPLERLLALSGFSASRHRLTVLGDLVNRGPQSAATLRRMMALGGSAQALLGNHDLHLLAVAHGVRPAPRSHTLDDVLQAPDRQALLDWLRDRPLALEVEGWLCVHAGVPPQWDAAQVLQHGAEVQTLLRGSTLAEFLPLMYGNEPALWRDDLKGPERWRFIINALTRMRWCGPDGTQDFLVKEGLEQAPPGLSPWFELPQRRTRHTPMAFGHWSTLGLINRPELLSLDTGCVWGGALTGVRVDGGRREVLQVACQAAQHPGA